MHEPRRCLRFTLRRLRSHAPPCAVHRRVTLCSATFNITLRLQHHPPSSPSLFTITFPFTLCHGSPFILTLRHGSPFTLPFPFTLPLQYHPRLRSASPLPAPPPPPPHCSSDGNSGGCLRPAAAPIPLTSTSSDTPSRSSPPHECISPHAQPHLSPGVLASVLPPDPTPTLTKMCTPPQASTRARGGFPPLEGA